MMTDVCAAFDGRIRDALVDAEIAEEEAIGALMEAERGLFQLGELEARGDAQTVKEALLLLRAIRRSGRPLQDVLSRVDSSVLWDELVRRDVLEASWEESLWLETCAVHCQREQSEGGG